MLYNSNYTLFSSTLKILKFQELFFSESDVALA